jgi:hypothetical protein
VLFDEFSPSESESGTKYRAVRCSNCSGSRMMNASCRRCTPDGLPSTVTNGSSHSVPANKSPSSVPIGDTNPPQSPLHSPIPTPISPVNNSTLLCHNNDTPEIPVSPSTTDSSEVDKYDLSFTFTPSVAIYIEKSADELELQELIKELTP